MAGGESSVNEYRPRSEGGVLGCGPGCAKPESEGRMSCSIVLFQLYLIPHFKKNIIIPFKSLDWHVYYCEKCNDVLMMMMFKL